ncbi:hypothetical protein EDB89DRAFT_2080503 [Lactarius sanguifluus]|nr:hypothetical protein EDB89DRAFT_2080503 [Lactarius sanguifluus]
MDHPDTPRFMKHYAEGTVVVPRVCCHLCTLPTTSFTDDTSLNPVIVTTSSFRSDQHCAVVSGNVSLNSFGKHLPPGNQHCVPVSGATSHSIHLTSVVSRSPCHSFPYPYTTSFNLPVVRIPRALRLKLLIFGRFGFGLALRGIAASSVISSQLPPLTVDHSSFPLAHRTHTHTLLPSVSHWISRPSLTLASRRKWTTLIDTQSRPLVPAPRIALSLNSPSPLHRLPHISLSRLSSQCPLATHKTPWELALGSAPALDSEQGLIIIIRLSFSSLPSPFDSLVRVVSPFSRYVCAFAPEVRPYRGHSKVVAVASPRLADTDGIVSRFASLLFSVSSVRIRIRIGSRHCDRIPSRPSSRLSITSAGSPPPTNSHGLIPTTSDI